jgi:dolichol-phosphate mannosyltransferase
MARCLVTGGTGFIGANLVRHLLEAEHDVHLLVRQKHNPERIEQFSGKVGVHVVDLSDRRATRRFVEELKPSWIFHLAANGAYSWQNDVDAIFQTNLNGLINLLEGCSAIGFDAFVNAGSSSEYGYKDHAPAEDELVEPNSYYATAKVAATQFCRFIAQSRKLPVATLRLYSAYGPYEDAGRLIPTIIRHGFEKSLPPLVDPSIARDYIYVDDVCSAFLTTAKLLAAGEIAEAGAVYNIGTGIQTSIEEVVNAARKLMNIRVEPVWGSMENRRWDTSVWVANNQKAVQQLCWKPQYNFEQGLAITIEWAKKARSFPSMV